MSKMTEQKDVWLNSFPSGKAWLTKLGSAKTKKIFTNFFKIYCDAVGKTPEQLIAFKIEGLKNVGTETEFQAETLLENFLSESTLKPSGKLMLKNAVFSFYKHNRRALEPTTASNVKNETPESKKRKPTLKDLEDLERQTHNARDKALIWFFASTACRIGTLVLLKWQDLKPTENPNVPFMLEIESARLKGMGKGRYKGLKQVTFLHKFASEKLQAYRQEATAKGYELKPDSPIFLAYDKKGKAQGLTISAMNWIFDELSLNAWGDLETKRFSPHDLREFFQSALESANIQENIISPIMAHKVKGIAQNYSSHESKELLKIYESALAYLVPKTIEVLNAEVTESKAKFSTQQSQIEELKGLVTQLLNHNKDLNFSTIGTPEDKQESKEVLDKREEQFKKIHPSYTHEPQQKQKMRQRDIDEYKRDGYDR